MKNLFTKHGLWVLFAAAVVSILLSVLSFTGAASPLKNVAGVLASPFRSAYTAVATWFNDKQDYYRDVNLLQEENARLRQELAEMEAAIRQAEADSAENKRLRELLNLRRQRRDLELESAFITEHTVTNWASSLTLDRGTDQGIAVGNCVIDETGALVGVIGAAGNNWSTVLTLVDTDTSLGARVFRTKDLGLATGTLSLMEQNLLRLEYLPAGCQLLSGDLVLTSGLGGFYPADLVIGTVAEVQVDDSGAASYAILQPQVDFDALTEVFVIKSFEIVS